MFAVMTTAAADRAPARPLDDDRPRPMRRVVYLPTARRRARLTQAELAERSGVSQSRICTLETTAGESTTDRNRAQLAYALGVDPALLRFGPNPKVLGAIKRERRRRR
jgi:transcriptional regulator with XRE-family HTH domain